MKQTTASPSLPAGPVSDRRSGSATGHPPPSGDDILSLVRQAWPGELPRQSRGGLPALALAALGIGGPKARLRRLAGYLDATTPGWTEVAAAAVAEGTRLGGLREEIALPCALLGLRPLRRPEVVVGVLDQAQPSDGPRFWLLLALVGTDTAVVRQAWRRELERCRGQVSGLPCWLAFARSLLGGWLGWEEFRECVVGGRVLDQAAAGRPGGRRGYRPGLEALGLWRHPRFAKWYRQAVYEAAHQPDVTLSFAAGGWIRDFPGEEYLWEALAMLETKPDSWWPLHLLRWAPDVDPGSEEVQSRLVRFSPLTLCLLSLVRPDFGEAVGSALGSPLHAAVVEWLRRAGPGEPLDLVWLEETVRPWAASTGEPFVEAVGALCLLIPPSDYRAGAGERRRRSAFLREHLLPEMSRLMDNLFYVYAAEKRHLPLTLEQARRGRPAAARALALWPERAEESAPVLLGLLREGARQSREAAREALAVLAGGADLADPGKRRASALTSSTGPAGEAGRPPAALGEVERRVDLALAWSDGGLDGRSARVWWDIAGYRVRLAVAGGEVRVQVYSRERPLAGVPAKVRQEARWEEVCESRARLLDSYRHFRQRFERAMVEGTVWSGGDFALLLASPVVRSLVARLVLLVDGEPVLWAQPDPAAEREALAGMRGAHQVRMAHPISLLPSGALEEWQERVIEERVAQPFKQVFREVYMPAQAEREGTDCSRFAGHPLEARQAFALLRQRGYAPRRGAAVKEWTAGGTFACPPALRACIEWAALEEPVGKLLGGAIEPVPVTSGAVWFEEEPGNRLRLSAVPPVVFSETLRDADLLVSRATAGELGFTSEETRRLRGALVRHVARALGLTSVYVSEDAAHVIVEGSLATYRVHLGSGSVLLEKSRRSLDVSEIGVPDVEVVTSESVDAHTARIIGTVVALSRDDQIAAPGFREQMLLCEVAKPLRYEARVASGPLGDPEGSTGGPEGQEPRATGGNPTEALDSW